IFNINKLSVKFIFLCDLSLSKTFLCHSSTDICAMLSVTIGQKERCRPFYRIHEERRMNPAVSVV
ncbi:MAG: hypothetical protein IKP99_01225, partial [Bacteroidales bacterium]|nr:hypothetical protein [Bacteroidales bacterium]